MSKVFEVKKLNELLESLIEDENLDGVKMILDNNKDYNNNNNNDDDDDVLNFDINRDNDGFTPLGLCIKKNNSEIAKLLIDNNQIYVNKRCCYYSSKYHSGWNTPLGYSMNKGNIEIVKMLLSHPDIDVNLFCYEYVEDRDFEESSNKWRPIGLAIKNQLVEVVKMILDHPQLDFDLDCIKYFYDQYDDNQLTIGTSIYDYGIKSNNKEIIEIIKTNLSN
eukprot:TRINITY_DN3397_c0_g2_i1.p1 TRINITY_DN3397_c0_g2~~TRINITY_DN3397_c0_g2_i1.p1  ORF type:complete len:220 (-),score=47.79 TRINITY_DN3397_c0_g2_i1:206-865(-)